MTVDRRETTAYHEAGHMVAAWDLGLRVVGATIAPNPDKGYLGAIRVPFEDRVRYAPWADAGGYQEAHLVTFLAGVEASTRHTGSPMTEEEVGVHLETPGSDHRGSAELVLEIAGTDGEKQDEVYEAAHRQASFLVHTRWEAIREVAGTLLGRVTLDEGECEEVLGNA